MKNQNKTWDKVWIYSFALIIIGLMLIIVSFIIQEYSDLTRPLGLSLITAAILAFTLDSVSLRMISEDLKTIVQHRLEGDEVRSYGITAVLNMTPYDVIDLAITESNDFILVQTWFPHLGSTVEHLKELIKRGGSVSIFLLHPGSAISEQRAIDLNREKNYVAAQTRSNTSEIRAMYSDLKNEKICTDKLKLFYFTSLPTFSLHKAGSRAWMGFYWYANQSDFGMNLVLDLKDDNHLKKLISRHISKLKSKALPVNLESNIEPPIEANTSILINNHIAQQAN